MSEQKPIITKGSQIIIDNKTIGEVVAIDKDGCFIRIGDQVQKLSREATETFFV